MRLVKNLRQLHPDGRKIVHVEKAPVIDLLRRDPPEREAIRLIAEECIERIEAARIARRPVDDREGFFDRFLHRGRFLAATLQPTLDHLLFPRPLGDALRIGLGAARQDIPARSECSAVLRNNLPLCARSTDRARSAECDGRCPARSEIHARNSAGKSARHRNAPAARRARARVRIDRLTMGSKPCRADRI